MATYFARKAGNINAADVWATTPTGTAAAVTFASGDVLISNNFTITVNVSVDLGASGQLRNDTTGGATSGGFFSLTNGVTLTGAAFSNAAAVLQFSTTGTAAFVGSLSQIGNGRGIDNHGTGTLNITYLGNFTGSAANNAIGIYNGSSGIINITSSGTFVGGAVSTCQGCNNVGGGQINFTGNLTGGAGGAGIQNSSTGTVVIVGVSTGGAGAAGVSNVLTGTVVLTRARGNAYGPGNTAGLAAAVGAANAGLGVIEIQELEYGTNGMSPTSGTGIRLKKANTNVAVFNYCDSAGAKTLIDATQNAAMPAATDVRSGVSYASGALTGTCAVPAAGSVALGVPVDNTTGTAVLTPADIWSHATRTITGGTVTTLTNAPTVPSASAIASQVWATPTTELTITGSIGERAKNQSTVSTTGAQLAAALS